MQFSRRLFLGAAVAATVGASTDRVIAQPKIEPLPLDLAPAEPSRGGRPPLLAEALAALDTHAYRFAHRDRIGLVDFSAHSRVPRFHLVDLAGGQVVRSWLVAHGNGSDPSATGQLQRFSNVPGSNASSRGAFLIGEIYLGRHGLSQRLIGLDPTNDNAFGRAIVLHGATYVAPALIAAQGRIGRSQGCFAVETGEIAVVMQSLGAGRMIYAGKSA